MKNLIVLGICTGFLYSTVMAQEQKPVRQLADEHYSRYEYTVAASLYEKLARKKSDTTLQERLATSYRLTNRYAAAARWYERITQGKAAAAEDWLYYGDMLKSLGKYPEAKEAYGQYLAKGGSSSYAAGRLAGCDSALVWMQHPTGHKVENVKEVNTSGEDWGAVWYEKSAAVKNPVVVFTSDNLHLAALDKKSKINKSNFGWTNYTYQKLYEIDTTAQTGYGTIRDITPTLNQFVYHVGPLSFSPSGDTVYVTVTNPNKIAYHKLKGEEVYGTRRLELLIGTKKEGKWYGPFPFRYNKPDAYSIAHAAVSKDGQVLYFASDMPGGQGESDIWYCEKQGDSTWSAPINCGPAINTPDDDEFPTIAADGSLYFSSKGHAGMGGFDLFRAEGSKAQWSQPRNLGYPLNSPADDFYYSAKDDYSGFISSNRFGGRGKDDIYRFLFTPPVVPAPKPRVLVLETTVLDKDTHEAIDAAGVELLNTNRQARWRQLTQPQGKTYNTLEQQMAYQVQAAKEGYTGDSTVLDTRQPAGDTLRVTLYLEKDKAPKVGETFVLHNLYYDLDKWNIRPDAARVLDSLVEVLNKYPTLKIELSSHTDSRASDAYNMQLSQKRAKSAVAYLVAHGIAANRLVARGYGETRLVNGCADGVKCSEAEHQANRRTEVKILER